MNGSGAMELLLKFVLDMVDLFMDILYIPVYIYLGMQRDHHSAWAVIMNDQVVNAMYQRMIQHDFPDLIDEFLFWWLSDEKIDHLL